MRRPKQHFLLLRLFLNLHNGIKPSNFIKESGILVTNASITCDPCVSCEKQILKVIATVIINSKASTKGNKGSDFFVLQHRQHLRLLYARHTIAGISTKTILFLYNLAFNYFISIFELFLSYYKLAQNTSRFFHISLNDSYDGTTTLKAP